jgi:hypothetical protein
LKIDPSGAVTMATPVSFPSKQEIWLPVIGLDSAGNVAMAGTDGQDSAVAKITPGGHTVATACIAGPKNMGWSPCGVALSPEATFLAGQGYGATEVAIMAKVGF